MIRRSHENFMLLWKRWSSRWGIVLLLGTIMGCGTGVLLQKDGEGGGVVQYLYQERMGHLLSSNRTRALNEISQYCGRAYIIVQEGPTRGRKRVVQGIASDDVITENWWGIRYSCHRVSGP